MPADLIHVPLVLIFMGVSGSGKSTIAARFCEKTGAAFFEGDKFHSTENVAKMKSGTPLNDDDRLPWLRRLREIIVEQLDKKVLGVLTCSALKASYREILQQGDDRVKFVFLHASQELIQARLNTRAGHFMPPTLLGSQLATLEAPADAWSFEAERPINDIVAGIIAKVSEISPR